MKIDIHTHTKKVKTGDAYTRNVTPARLSEILRNTDVSILAITNHNHFDITQFKEITESVKDVCQIWPGIELDIVEDEKRAHLLVIANPNAAEIFDHRCKEILGTTSPNVFGITIADVVEKFKDIDCLYIAHYLNKTPNLSDEQIDLLSRIILNPKRIIKEAANSISAGIFISHGHNSIYGSDVQDWEQYEKDSLHLPELRLPVDSFEQFCLLLEKDEATINTVLAGKKKEVILIDPFKSAAETIDLPLFNDINIIFGSKGTGKTDILDAICRYYNDLGFKTNVYKSTDTHLSIVFDLKGSTLDFNAPDFNISDCEEEIQFLKDVEETDVTHLSAYKNHFSEVETNARSQLLKIRNITKIDEESTKRKLLELKEVVEIFNNFKEKLVDDDRVGLYVDNTLLNSLLDILKAILSEMAIQIDEKFLDASSLKLLNQIVHKINFEIAKKTGIPPKPSTTGFSNYARNRIAIERAANVILGCINQTIQPIDEFAGSLNLKGDLYCRTCIVIQSGNFSEPSFETIKKHDKTPLKNFAKSIKSISKHIYSNDLFEKITDLNAVEHINDITKISDLSLYQKHFILSGKPYKPSTGESSMILLHRELIEDKDVYLLDEPERSLGNDYISDVIVPLLKEKALLGKKVVIATHDANIAVRTLPYNSIYRLRENGQNYTLTGNPFFNTLKCIHGSITDLDWKEISMKTLEGGKSAFGERSKIYGN